MRRLISTQKFIFLILLSVAGVLASGWTFVRISYGTMNARASILQAETDTKQFEEDQASARALARVVQDRATDIRRLQAFFVNKQEPVAFIEQLEDLGRATHTSVALSLPTTAGEGDTLSFRMTLDGSPRDLQTYLKLLGLVPYDVAIHDLVFQKLEEGTRNPDGTPASSHRLTILISTATASAGK